jgi:hypothetical protein
VFSRVIWVGGKQLRFFILKIEKEIVTYEERVVFLPGCGYLPCAASRRPSTLV